LPRLPLHPVFSLFCCLLSSFFLFFFFKDPATTEIYTLSLHDALPISRVGHGREVRRRRRHLHGGGLRIGRAGWAGRPEGVGVAEDRKSTRLNSSHSQISYAVFCLKKKKKNKTKNKKAQCRKDITNKLT